MLRYCLMLVPVLCVNPLWAEPLPSEVLDLSCWKLTLPVDTSRPGHPDEIEQPDLATFRDAEFFDAMENTSSVVFRAPCGGATTKGSKYPRSELREMQADGTTLAAWDMTDGGTHTLSTELAITKTPTKKPHVICLQIHGKSEKLLAIRVEGQKLIAEGDSHPDTTILNPYVLGTPLKIQVSCHAGHIQVQLDEQQVIDWQDQRSDCYFKVGCYTQSNPESGDLPDATGEVVVYRLAVKHEQ